MKLIYFQLEQINILSYFPGCVMSGEELMIANLIHGGWRQNQGPGSNVEPVITPNDDLKQLYFQCSDSCAHKQLPFSQLSSDQAFCRGLLTVISVLIQNEKE